MEDAEVKASLKSVNHNTQTTTQWTSNHIKAAWTTYQGGSWTAGLHSDPYGHD